MHINDDQVYDLLEEPYIKKLKTPPPKEQSPVLKKHKKSKKHHKNRARSRSNEPYRTPSDNDPMSDVNQKDYEDPKEFRNIRSRRRDDRDARTVYVWQISHRVVKRDLYDFFSAVGKIRTVRLIHDPKTGRSKGIGYIEFREIESAQLAIGLSGIRLLGVPLQVQPIKTEYDAKTAEQIEEELEAERRKRDPYSQERRQRRFRTGPTKIYVGSLHYNINEEMLKGIFEPFGTIDVLNLVKNEFGKSQGYAYITFSEHDFALKAVNSMDNFELAGRPMKVTLVSDKTDAVNFKILDENNGKGGIQMGTTGRIALMAKLAEGTDMKLPRSAMAQLHISQQKNGLGTTSGVGLGSSKTTSHSQCFLLSNMFDPHKACGTMFKEITEDIIEECSKFGGILHLFIDKTSAQGNIYIKCPDVDIAAECVNQLHGRFFSGQQITASYVPVKNYNRLFPNSVDCRKVIKHVSELN